MLLSPHDRDRMERRLRDMQQEIDHLLEEGLTEEDDLAAQRVDALREEVSRLETMLDPDRAERRRAEGRSERD